MKHLSNRLDFRLGFSLVELAMSMAVTATLVGGMIYLSKTRMDNAALQKTAKDMEVILSAAEDYKLRNNAYPTDLSILSLPNGFNGLNAFSSPYVISRLGNTILVTTSNLPGSPCLYTKTSCEYSSGTVTAGKTIKIAIDGRAQFDKKNFYNQ